MIRWSDEGWDWKDGKDYFGLVRKGLSGEVYQQRLEGKKELSMWQSDRELFHARGESSI